MFIPIVEKKHEALKIMIAWKERFSEQEKEKQFSEYCTYT